MTIEELNKLSRQEVFEVLFKCCSSKVWSQNVSDFKPYKDKEELLKLSDMVWMSCENDEVFEAFSHHPKIGDLTSLEKKFASTKEWASEEQAGVNVASSTTLEELAKANGEYEQKFGYTFIVCATGKTADEMLSLLLRRLMNDPDTEYRIAKAEQNKITHIRLDKLIA